MNTYRTITELGARGVNGARSGTAGPSWREKGRNAVEVGLPVEGVKELQAELKRLGGRRPGEYVDSIVSRATLQRRDRLKPAEGEQLVRVASVLATAEDVWGDTEAAAEFLTSPHPMLGGGVPIDLALSEIGARQVEHTLLSLDLGLPV